MGNNPKTGPTRPGRLPMHHTDEERTAYHEAGHAVLAVVLGVPLKTITIEEDVYWLSLASGRAVSKSAAPARASKMSRSSVALPRVASPASWYARRWVALPRPYRRCGSLTRHRQP